LATQEAAALRAPAAEPEYRRRDLLDDLASRLDALARYLAAGDAAEALRALVTLLRDPARSVAERWDTALSTLDALATGLAPHAKPADPAPDRRRGGFWRRG
jgi:Ca-activated chloride channel family protein